MRSKLLIAALVLTPSLAFAHGGAPGHTHSFMDGVLHPLNGLDHLLAAFAIGLWAVVSGMRRPWLVPLTFVAAMTAATLAGASGIVLPRAEWMIAASVMALGLLCLFAPRLPVAAGMAIAALFALAHGYAHGSEGDASTPYLAGLIASTAALHVAGMASGYLALFAERPALARLAGAVIAVGGVFVLVA
ncbi:HupE / UreJ protein [Variibacter gotjawalensis]|uniref:HupE / UreJ protein n=1 Tax=Variibacter gotjawalensis TaxID=1333996 RepID=A0A0S3PSC0_9BRAD|nr:HupE/UreJ family protein [Variibacter gotjawalensis]NIK49143.1 urease accessory protein [Variibacter gotjawalensis]RZS50999.1 urease accessory protein [Variibacter gotjawalensis]BAT58833.1 HupE / UreJ protein [Variibacter gotjawalensis]